MTWWIPCTGHFCTSLQVCFSFSLKYGAGKRGTGRKPAKNIKYNSSTAAPTTSTTIFTFYYCCFYLLYYGGEWWWQKRRMDDDDDAAVVVRNKKMVACQENIYTYHSLQKDPPLYFHTEALLTMSRWGWCRQSATTAGCAKMCMHPLYYNRKSTTGEVFDPLPREKRKNAEGERRECCCYKNSSSTRAVVVAATTPREGMDGLLERKEQVYTR